MVNLCIIASFKKQGNDWHARMSEVLKKQAVVKPNDLATLKIVLYS